MCEYLEIIDLCEYFCVNQSANKLYTGCCTSARPYQLSGKAGAAIGFGPDLPDSRVPFQRPGLWDRIKESHLDRFRTPASRRPEMHDARNRVPLEDCRAPTITATIDAFSDSSAGVGSSHLGIACCSCWQCLFGADRGQEAGPTSRRFGMK